MTVEPLITRSPWRPEDCPMALRLYLFRHGETDWSLSGRYTGRTDLPLTAHGEDAAAKLGVRIRNILFTRVLTSPLRRAQETCKLAGLGQSFEIDTDLTEWDNGDDEGRMPAEILKSQPGWDLFRDGSPHGEMPAQICPRADRLIARLRAMNGNVALFSHGHLLRVLAARWIGLSVRQAQHFLLNTASLSVLSYEHNCACQPAIALWNLTVQESFEPRPENRVGDTRPMKQRAIERWESEGGEIPIEQIQTKAAAKRSAPL